MPCTASGPVVLLIGASRGIGSAIAKVLGAAGFRVVLTARSTAKTKPGSQDNIDNIAAAVKARGGEALALYCDVVKVESLASVVEQTISNYGRVDAVIYNAGAIWWATVEDTPLKRYDLLHSVNARGLYALMQKVLPIFNAAGHGTLIAVAPPIYSRFVRGKTAYAMSKFSMTTLCLGLAHEYKDTGMAFTTLWPATGIQSAVTDKLESDPGLLRKPSIFADACLLILRSPASKVNGKTLIDEDFLRQEDGVKDFSKYQLVQGIEPPRMMPRHFPVLSVAEEEDGPVFDTAAAKSRL